MDPRISLVTLGVADVERSAAFYRDLGLPRMDVDSEEAAFFTTEGTWLALYRRDLLAEEVHAEPNEAGRSDETDEPGEARFSGVTLAHNVGSMEEVDAVLRESEEAGAEIRQPGIEREWGGYSGYFADPDGHLWEVAWNPDFDIA